MTKRDALALSLSLVAGLIRRLPPRGCSPEGYTNLIRKKRLLVVLDESLIWVKMIVLVWDFEEEKDVLAFFFCINLIITITLLAALSTRWFHLNMYLQLLVCSEGMGGQGFGSVGSSK